MNAHSPSTMKKEEALQVFWKENKERRAHEPMNTADQGQKFYQIERRERAGETCEGSHLS